MMDFLKKTQMLFSGKPRKTFSDFVRSSSLDEKQRVFKKVMKQSNKDQREILESYAKKFPS